MKLQNLQIQFHGKDPLQHRITYVNENGTQCRDTLCSGVEFAQHVIDCLESPPRLREERDVLISMRNDLETLIKGCDHWKGNNFDSVTHLIEIANERDALRESHSMISALLHIASTKPSDIMKAVDTLRRERGELQGTINGLKHLVELPESAGLTELFNAVEALELNKPQLSEIRYVLHGDIQPCSVLYSDDTTTLLRLDEGDVMCETDTIEWSDSVTYRCQELLKSTWAGTGTMQTRYAEALAQLVRDERILLNDNADDAGVPDTELFPNAADRWRCTSCLHDFPVALERCPKCYTPKTAPCQPDTPSEWADTNSPTPLR